MDTSPVFGPTRLTDGKLFGRGVGLAGTYQGYREIDRLSREECPVWFLVQTGGGKRGWVGVNLDVNAILPDRVIGQLLASLPLVTLDGAEDGAGLPDMAFGEPTRLDQPGEECIPGQPVSEDWLVAIRNGGTGVSPRTFTIAIDGTVRTITWARGLEPGEEIDFGLFPPQAVLELDPDGRIEEASEGNNVLRAPPSAQLLCVPG